MIWQNMVIIISFTANTTIIVDLDVYDENIINREL